MVAEVLIEGRWVVVDPLFHAILKDPSGHLLTRSQLADPNVLEEATREFTAYDSLYKYEVTAHIRLEEIPLFGGALRRLFDLLFPTWEESFDWTLLLERQSYAVLIMGAMLVLLSLFSRLMINRYGKKRLGIDPLLLREHLMNGAMALTGNFQRASRVSHDSKNISD